MFCGPAKHWFRLFVLKKVCITFICTFVSPSWWQWIWKCDHCLLTSFTYTAIYRLPWFYQELADKDDSNPHTLFHAFFPYENPGMKGLLCTQEYRGSNAKYKTGMKELTFHVFGFCVRMLAVMLMCSKSSLLHIFSGDGVRTMSLNCLSMSFKFICCSAIKTFVYNYVAVSYTHLTLPTSCCV